MAARREPKSAGTALSGRPDAASILRMLREAARPGAVKGMARYGITPKKALGVSVPTLRAIARRVGPKDHSLASELWSTGIHEARILASIVDDPHLVTEAQMERWVSVFDSWDVCDQCCGNLFDKTPFAMAKAVQWSGQNEEFVKRAGFALMAWMSFHDHGRSDTDFISFLPVIEREASDERNYVKKAVNWALRQIGKRNIRLNGLAIEVANRLTEAESPSARWVASDALRELTAEKTRKKLRTR